MYSGFYTLASGILTRQNEIDVLGNNLTNVKTPGYKTDRVETSAFEMELMVRMENGASSSSSQKRMRRSLISSKMPEMMKTTPTMVMAILMASPGNTASRIPTTM